MLVLLFGSFIIGISGRFSPSNQTRLALLAASTATIIFFLSQRAM